MGSYLNPGNKGFRESLNSAIYIDKTGFIEKMNSVLDTTEIYLCQPSKKIWKICGGKYVGSIL